MAEASLLWKESTTADVFTYQGLTSCMEPDQTLTIMGSMWHLLCKRAGRSDGDLRAFVHNEVAYQNRIEAAGYRSPSWRVLRSLQGIQAATQLQGESAVSAPPFSRSAGRGQTLAVFWGQPIGPTAFLWESLDEEGRRACEEVVRTRTDWVVCSGTRPTLKEEQTGAHTAIGKTVFKGRARLAQNNNQIECDEKLSDEEMEEAH